MNIFLKLIIRRKNSGGRVQQDSQLKKSKIVILTLKGASPPKLKSDRLPVTKNNSSSAPFTSMPNYQNIPSGVRYATTTPNDSVSKVDYTGTSGQTTGPSLLLKVMSGDTVKIGVQCYYNSNTLTTTNTSFTSVLNSLAAGIMGTPTGGAEGTLSGYTSSTGTVYGGLSSFLSTKDQAPPSGYPKAYLNYIFLDDQFNYVSSLSGAVAAASGTYPAGSMNTVAPGSQIALNKNGYLYIWVSNETQGWDVFFDNLAVQYKQGPVLEENHYYPFGLSMAGISDKAVKTQYPANRFKANSGSELQNQEFSDGSGLESYDAVFRMYDPQIGRFWQIDPLAEVGESWSPYSFVLDNPIAFNDPLGLTDSVPYLPLVTVTPGNNAPPCCQLAPIPGTENAGATPLPIVPPPEVPPLTVVPPSPDAPSIEDPIPEFPPIINPFTILTTIFVSLPITGNTDWPLGDEMFFHKHPELNPWVLKPIVGNKPVEDLYLNRFGSLLESKEKLSADAAAAAMVPGFGHGVSTRLSNKPLPGAKSAKLLDVMKVLR